MRILSMFWVFYLCSCQLANAVEHRKSLSFSNTQSWGEYTDKILQRKPVKLDLNENELSQIQPPPQGLSQEMQDEIEILLSLQNHRTIEQVIKINQEIGFCGWEIGAFKFGLDAEVDNFLLPILYDASAIGYKLKKRFDRVRPKYYDARIEPAITTPDHAAFPSNHSLESHILAHILGDLFPDRKEAFLADANRIARHREIAGVHYPSDSKAGSQVANLLYTKLSNDQDYINAVNKIKKLSSQFWIKKTITDAERTRKCQTILKNHAYIGKREVNAKNKK